MSYAEELFAKHREELEQEERDKKQRELDAQKKKDAEDKAYAAWAACKDAKISCEIDEYSYKYQENTVEYKYFVFMNGEKLKITISQHDRLRQEGHPSYTFRSYHPCYD